MLQPIRVQVCAKLTVTVLLDKFVPGILQSSRLLFYEAPLNSSALLAVIVNGMSMQRLYPQVVRIR